MRKGLLKKLALRFIPHRVVPFSMATQQWAEVPLALKFLFGKANFDGDILTYEREFARVSDVDHAVSFGSGRMALYAILKALDLKAGDEIIVPAYTCVVVVNAMHYLGIKPLYVDIQLTDFNLNVDEVAKATSTAGPRLRAIYAQHTFGYPCEIEKLRKLADEHSLLLIEDCAHGPLGHEFSFGKIGTLGDAAFYSTDRTKYISTVLGGMALTKDTKVAARLKDVQAASASPDRSFQKWLAYSFLTDFLLTRPAIYFIGRLLQSLLVRLGKQIAFRDELSLAKPTDDDYPVKLTGLQAAIGLKQLRILPQLIAMRKKLVAHWTVDSPLPLLRFPFLVTSRAAAFAELRDQSDQGVWFTSPLHGRDSDLEALGYLPGQCPNAEYAAKHIMNLPLHPTLLRRPFDLRRIRGGSTSWAGVPRPPGLGLELEKTHE